MKGLIDVKGQKEGYSFCEMCDKETKHIRLRVVDFDAKGKIIWYCVQCKEWETEVE